MNTAEKPHQFVDDNLTNRVRRMVRDLSLLPAKLNASSRAVPDFLIIGTQKGGTTSFYDDLVQHPRIAPARVKEIHYFDMNYHKGPSWYRAHFPVKQPGKMYGEASPYYLFHPLAPQRIKKDLPQAKFVVMLRNPVDRAFSKYHLEIKIGNEPLSFDQAVDAELQRLPDESIPPEQWTRQQDLHHRHHSYLARGRYAEQLERWFEYFPREQFLIIPSEDYFADAKPVFDDLMPFLGLEPWQPAERSWSKRGGYGEKMSDATRAKLRTYFKPHNERLEQLLGRSFHWD